MTFNQRILQWFDQYGRKNLPWQQNITPYRVWVSEIMLQQTQVATVIPYFEKFMQRFATVEILASAPLDDVLHYWSGLGYYSRAKNLHKAAQQVIEQYQGQFPNTVEALCELPGIGRSTAGAIVSIAFQEKAAILDGNVKRVIARHQGITGWPGKTATLNALWQKAEAFTPDNRCNDYSQAMMDLGATCCTRSKPNCTACPISLDCIAYNDNRIDELPGKKPKKILPVKQTTMLVIEHGNSLLLEQRPLIGIWPGLYSFIEVADEERIAATLQQLLPEQAYTANTLQGFRHTFSHYHLDIAIAHIQLTKKPQAVMADNQQLWYNLAKPAEVGLAAPVQKIIASLEKHHEQNRLL